MKITILTTSYPLTQRDSTGNFVAGLAEELAKDNSVEVIAPHGLLGARDEDVRGVRVHRFRYAPQSIEKVAYGFGILGNLR